ncbi:MAG: Protein-tyrosine-phosphatase [Solirubrobacterales bacterium]|nr:Protein-tyrosine-phosphatase [Solirubrobacterales bacterium]
MIDLHCHVLPGIDDGPETIEGSVELARTALAAGIRTLVATPHVNARTPNDAETIARLVRSVNERLAAEQVELDVLPGAEIAMTQLVEVEPAELERLGLGGGRWLLVEPPFTLVATGLQDLVLGLQRRGHGVVLAHPERCPALHRDRRMVRTLADAGILMSVTAGSLAGRFGGEVRRYALALAREGLIHNVTSDAHDSVNRPPGLAQELEQAGLAPLADWLTRLVPEAILQDEPIPARPSAVAAGDGAPRRTWRLRR